MSHKYSTPITFNIAGSEHEFDATITYSRHKGFPETRTDPAEPASVEIMNIRINGCETPDFVFNKICDDPAILAELMADWEADAEFQRECHADMIRDERMARDM